MEFSRNQLTKELFQIYKSIMPEMSSRTEGKPMTGDTTWWEADLFASNPDWEEARHSQHLCRKELRPSWTVRLKELCPWCHATGEVTSVPNLSPEVWQYLKDNKFFYAAIIRRNMAGWSSPGRAQSCVLQNCAAPAPLLSTVGVPNSLGPGELLLATVLTSRRITLPAPPGRRQRDPVSSFNDQPGKAGF